MTAVEIDPEKVAANVRLLESLTEDLSNQVIRITNARDGQSGVWSGVPAALDYESRLSAVTAGLLSRAEGARLEVLGLATSLQANVAGHAEVDEDTQERISALITTLENDPVFTAARQVGAGLMRAV